MRTLLVVLNILSILAPCATFGKEIPNKEKRTFYAIGENDTVLTFQIFVIEKNEFVFDELDMEWYANHLSNIYEEGDSLIELYFDKVINTDEYKRGNIVFYEEATPIIKKTVLRKNSHSAIWERWDDDESYKYRLIDSLDIQRSGYAVDTVNHWLDDVDIDNDSAQLTEKTSSNDNVLIGLIDNDTFTDTLYVHRESTQKYDELDCQEQTDKVTLRIILGGNRQKTYAIEDENTFYFPYAGSAALTYNIDSPCGIVRSCVSSRHGDHLYDRSYYRYNATQDYWFKVKAITIQEESGEKVLENKELFETGKYPLGTEIRIAGDL